MKKLMNLGKAFDFNPGACVKPMMVENGGWNDNVYVRICVLGGGGDWIQGLLQARQLLLSFSYTWWCCVLAVGYVRGVKFKLGSILSTLYVHLAVEYHQRTDVVCLFLRNRGFQFCQTVPILELGVHTRFLLDPFRTPRIWICWQWWPWHLLRETAQKQKGLFGRMKGYQRGTGKMKKAVHDHQGKPEQSIRICTKV